MLNPNLVSIANGLAEEGVPIQAAARALHVPSEVVRGHLRLALSQGDIIELPAEDWPAGTARLARVPSATSSGDMYQLILKIRTVFKLTAQQAIVFATLLNRPIATKEHLLSAIQQHRLTKRPLPSNLEEPQLKLIDVLICNMRKRLASIGASIETVWGVGYMISEVDRIALSKRLKAP